MGCLMDKPGCVPLLVKWHVSWEIFSGMMESTRSLDFPRGGHGISYVHTVHHGIVMGHASGPGLTVKNRNGDGLGRVAAHPLKFGWAGPGRDPSSPDLMDRAGPRLMRRGLCMGRSARPIR